MKKVYLTLIALLAVISASAQGWPANYNGHAAGLLLECIRGCTMESS